MNTPSNVNNPNPLPFALMASNSKYVSAEAQGASPLQASGAVLGQWETFQLFPRGDLSIALMAANAKYVTISDIGTPFLIASGDAIDANAVFTLEPIDDVRVAIVASNGKYVSNVGGGAQPLQANQDQIGQTEIFVMTPVGGQVHEAVPDRTTTAPTKRAAAVAAVGTQPFTVCFSGTGCTRDEGEVSRHNSNKAIYCADTGYIPVRINKEITGSLTSTNPSVTVRGVGENDWANNDNSEPLVLDGPLSADSTLLSYSRPYSGGNQYSQADQVDGWPMPALALHAANLAALSGAPSFNFVGHSRGAAEAVMAAWFLYAYGSDAVKKIPVNIFAIDPVPGPGEWYSILTQLAPNVASYVGVYAWDMCIMPADKPYQAVVPRPNGRMTGKPNDVEIPYYWYWPWNRWKYLAYDSQKQDPLASANDPQPSNYELFACRGRHSTVAGNATSNSEYDPAKVSDDVMPVPELVYRMARAYLTSWGVTFPQASAVTDTALALRREFNINHRLFDAMGGGATRNSVLPDRPYVRRVSSIMGSNPFNTYYMDNVVGDPPYTMAYPVTNERTDTGWVNWKFL